MNQLKITVDPTDKKQMQALAAYFGILAGASVEVPKENQPVQKENRVETNVKPAKEEKPEDEAPVEKKEKPEGEVITLAYLQQLTSQKVEAGFKTEIKDKLTELGAHGVSKLDEKNYPAFKTFLEEL